MLEELKHDLLETAGMGVVCSFYDTDQVNDGKIDRPSPPFPESTPHAITMSWHMPTLICREP